MSALLLKTRRGARRTLRLSSIDPFDKGRRMYFETDDLAHLVAAAAADDDGAWAALFDRFNGLLWSIARAHRLDRAAAADVVSTTWLRLVEHIDGLREPEHVGAWLATTARRECLSALRRGQREKLVGDEVLEAFHVSVDSPESAVVDNEERALVWQALEQMPPRCRRLLRVLMASPAPSYREVSAALDVPVGSIGPTRARCLDCLRERVERMGLGTRALAPA